MASQFVRHFGAFCKIGRIEIFNDGKYVHPAKQRPKLQNSKPVKPCGSDLNVGF